MQIVLLVLTIVGAILGLIAGLIGNVTLGVVSTLLVVICAIWQYYAAQPFIKTFSEADWRKTANEYVLSIPASRHRKGKGASAKIYHLTDVGYEVVECNEVEQGDGSFTTRASRPFNGRLVLK
jgi:hypothetical protein